MSQERDAAGRIRHLKNKIDGLEATIKNRGDGEAVPLYQVKDRMVVEDGISRSSKVELYIDGSLKASTTEDLIITEADEVIVGAPALDQSTDRIEVRSGGSLVFEDQFDDADGSLSNKGWFGDLGEFTQKDKDGRKVLDATSTNQGFLNHNYTESTLGEFLVESINEDTSQYSWFFRDNTSDDDYAIQLKNFDDEVAIERRPNGGTNVEIINFGFTDINNWHTYEVKFTVP